MLSRAAAEPYGDAGPLARVALDSAGTELVVAVHHGCADGLGLLGYAAAVSGLDLPSSARGVPASAEPRNFLRSSFRRLREALVHPPARIASAGRTGEGSDLLVTRDVTRRTSTTPALVLAMTRAVRAWNAALERPVAPVVIALGMSRRSGTPTPPPDRDTAYARLATDTVHSLRRRSPAARGDPARACFPVTRAAGIGPLVTRALDPRLGSSALVSNLGLSAGRCRAAGVLAGAVGTRRSRRGAGQHAVAHHRDGSAPGGLVHRRPGGGLRGPRRRRAGRAADEEPDQ